MIFGDGEVQTAFALQQSLHECSDCSLRDLRSELMSAGITIDTSGAGTVIGDDGRSLTEVHLFPHCGIELPTPLLERIGHEQFPQIARLVHDNADTGSLAIYRELALQVAQGRLQGAAIAGYHLSRLLVDGNRRLAEERTSETPYSGSSGLYLDYLASNRSWLLSALTDPWLDRVNSILNRSEQFVVYHHHTYEPVSLGSAPHEQAPFATRPSYQLFRARPALGPSPGLDAGLAPIDLLEQVSVRMGRFWTRTGSEIDGTIDFPFWFPVTPFEGCVNDGKERRHVHIVYEVRKDLLARPGMISQFVESRPWSVT